MRPTPLSIAALGFTLLCMALFSGCGDDGPTTPRQDKLPGTWNCTKWEIIQGDGTFDRMEYFESITMTFGDYSPDPVADTTGTWMFGTWTLFATGDVNHEFCGSSATSCTQTGRYGVREGAISLYDIALRPIEFDYTIVSDVLRMSNSGLNLRFVRA